jgi:hypothetical protein
VKGAAVFVAGALLAQAQTKKCLLTVLLTSLLTVF